MPKFFDVHTHAQFAAFKDDSKEVIDRALANGVWLTNVGSQKETSKKAVELSHEYEKGVYSAIGLHPIHVENDEFDPSESLESAKPEPGFKKEEFDYEFFKALAADPKVVAIGECGLDYFHLSSDSKSRQKEIFIEHLKLANEIKKPVMIHCREAYDDLIQTLAENKSLLSETNPGIIHFFSGDKNQAEKLLAFGFSFSFGGVITFSGSYDEILKFIPLQNLLLETDAPYVAPNPFRGKRNEPLYVIETAKYLGKVKNLPLDLIGQKTAENALRVFAIKE